MEQDFLAVMGQANAAWNQRTGGFPAFALFNVSGAGGHTTDGPDGLYQGRVQVNCYGTSYKQAREAATAARVALDGHIGSGFLGIWHDGTRDLTSNLEDTGRLFAVALDFRVTYRQQEPTP